MDEKDRGQKPQPEQQPAGQLRHSQITLMTDMFTAHPEGGGEDWQALGVTTIVDGWLRQFFDTIKGEMPELPEDIDVFRAILFAGMDEMRRQLDARRVEQDL